MKPQLLPVHLEAEPGDAFRQHRSRQRLLLPVLNRLGSGLPSPAASRSPACSRSIGSSDKMRYQGFATLDRPVFSS